MWIARDCEALVKRMARKFPAVLVTGARQVGKTSLLRHLFPGASYLTLDFPGDAEAARSAPERLLDRYSEPLIIDEIQYAPSLLRYLKTRIDRDRAPGRFFLTGSQALPLMQGVSESLAGRCGILNLHTLGQSELVASGCFTSGPSSMFRGGYPELYTGMDAGLWFPSYVATYLERDIRNVLRVVDLQEFHRLLRASALRTGQVLNYSDLARDTGIAPNTARKWLSLLHASGIIALAEPYFGNRTKRLIKAPKLIFLDTGLAAFLAGFRSEKELASSSYAGAFWESYVFGQLTRLFAARGADRSICYWRTASGQEVDFVVETAGTKLIAIECKLKEHPGLGDTAGLRRLVEAEGKRVAHRYVVCGAKSSFELPNGSWAVNIADLLERL